MFIYLVKLYLMILNFEGINQNLSAENRRSYVCRLKITLILYDEEDLN